MKPSRVAGDEKLPEISDRAAHEPTNIIAGIKVGYFVACKCIGHYKNDPV
jgi:hypothetical protein